MMYFFHINVWYPRSLLWQQAVKLVIFDVSAGEKTTMNDMTCKNSQVQKNEYDMQEADIIVHI